MVKKNPFLLFTIVIVVLFFVFQRIAIDIGGFELPFSLLIMSFFAFFSFLNNKISIDLKRMIIYFLIALVSLLSGFLVQEMKVTSLLYFLFIYLFFIFDYNFEENELMIIKKTIIIVLAITSIIGIMQFISQIIGISYFDFYDLIPANFKLSGFNSYYSIWYGSNIMKSNGWLYLEPSFFSQFMALGIIIVLNKKDILKKDILLVVLFTMALITSFSGTGLLLIIISLVPLLIGLKGKNRIIFTIFAVVVVILFVNSDYSYSVLSRIGETSSVSSSASKRFINPFVYAFSSDNNHYLLGNGAGTVDGSTELNIYNFSAIPKIQFEYGLIVLILFMFFLFMFFFKKGFNFNSFVFVIMFLFLAGNLLQPSIIFIIYIINLCYGSKRDYKSCFFYE